MDHLGANVETHKRVLAANTLFPAIFFLLEIEFCIGGTGHVMHRW